MQEHDAHKILLCGDSAGAHLAAGLNYALFELNMPSPFAQILIYPMVCPSLNFESMELYKENFLLTKSSMQWFWSQLRFSEIDNENPKLNLLKQEKTIGILTKTLIITAGFDPLHDEGIAYADLLEKNGIIVIHRHNNENEILSDSFKIFEEKKYGLLSYVSLIFLVIFINVNDNPETAGAFAWLVLK